MGGRRTLFEKMTDAEKIAAYTRIIMRMRKYQKSDKALTAAAKRAIHKKADTQK